MRLIFAPQSIIIGLYNVLASERCSYEYYQNRFQTPLRSLSAVALFISALPGLFAGTGTHISFLSASFYDSKPGEYTSGKTLPETIAFIKNCAEQNGLNDLIYGVDEGRLLCPALEHFCEVARLTPVTRTAEVKDGVLDLEYTLGASNVLFLEIK